MTYGLENMTLTKQSMKTLRCTKRAIQRWNVLDITLKYRMKNEDIRKKTTLMLRNKPQNLSGTG